MKRRLILASLVILSIPGFAQYGYIPDANFRTCLKEMYPFAFTNSDSLILQEVSNIKLIDCANRSVVNLEGVQYFINIEGLLVDHNPIATIPNLSGLSELVTFTCGNTGITALPDISGCSKLMVMFANNNELGTFPDFTSNTQLRSIDVQFNNIAVVPDLSHLPALEFFFLTGNPVTSLPDLSSNRKLKALGMGVLGVNEVPDLSALHDLEVLNINDNNLEVFPAVNSANLRAVIASNNDFTNLPDFSNTLLGTQVSQLGSHLAIQDNRLTFEDLLPFVNREFTSLQMSPQKKPNPDSNVFVPLHDTYTIELPFDHEVTSSVYTWYKDGQLLAITTTNKLLIADVGYDDSGMYHTLITNPNIPDLTIESGAVTVTVIDCDNVPLEEFSVTISPTTCIAGGRIFMHKDGEPATAFDELRLEDINTGVGSTSPTAEITDIPAGTYKLFVKKNNCELEWPETLEVGLDLNCDHPVISPNNDGMYDYYEIPFQGQIKIYNRAGVLVNQFAGPASWNGIDSSGYPVPMGLYIIVSDGQKEIAITIIR